jgi:zinc D-Ala-D-Ala carboxypeptidase
VDGPEQEDEVRIRPTVVLLVAVTLAIGGGAAVPTKAGVAPPCRVADVLTPYRASGDWYRSLLDTEFRLASAFTPRDLVPVSGAGIPGRGSVRKLVLDDLRAMWRDARAAGAPFAVQSAYRSYGAQVQTFKEWVAKSGYKRALLGSARPGHSEHQLGTALDLKTPGGPEPWTVGDWGKTRAGAWIAGNAWKYGFVISYPKGRSPAASCYKYEPWHVRYFGRAIAREIHESGLYPREWLWASGAAGTWTGPDSNGVRPPRSGHHLLGALGRLVSRAGPIVQFDVRPR